MTILIIHQIDIIFSSVDLMSQSEWSSYNFYRSILILGDAIYILLYSGANDVSLLTSRTFCLSDKIVLKPNLHLGMPMYIRIIVIIASYNLFLGSYSKWWAIMKCSTWKLFFSLPGVKIVNPKLSYWFFRRFWIGTWFHLIGPLVQECKTHRDAWLGITSGHV